MTVYITHDHYETYSPGYPSKICPGKAPLDSIIQQNLGLQFDINKHLNQHLPSHEAKREMLILGK